MSIVLTTDKDVENVLFSDYDNLNKTEVIFGTVISYSFDEGANIGKSHFSYNGYSLYVSFNVECEKDMLAHLRDFVNFQ